MGASQLGGLGGREGLGALEGQAGLGDQGHQASLGGHVVLLLQASLLQGTQGGLGGPVPLWGLEFQVVQWDHSVLQSLGCLEGPANPEPPGFLVLPSVQAALEHRGALANLCAQLPPWALWDLANPSCPGAPLHQGNLAFLGSLEALAHPWDLVAPVAPQSHLLLWVLENQLHLEGPWDLGFQAGLALLEDPPFQGHLLVLSLLLAPEPQEHPLHLCHLWVLGSLVSQSPEGLGVLAALAVLAPLCHLEILAGLGSRPGLVFQLRASQEVLELLGPQ